MTADTFRKTLIEAIGGSNEALADIIEMYMPLINRYSYVDGELDEDLRQYIFLHIFKNLSKFCLKRVDFPISGCSYRLKGNPHALHLENFTV
ncbi:helix-turn-helix domain-containing protein [Acutalibacter sp. JLR.KK004]|uniref:helix-turn-helix domain-containing protein n=1 Tax=Acutalibacter sp. JLR.KK004 TaxID=3112622 RepID=UPI002FF2B85A